MHINRTPLPDPPPPPHYTLVLSEVEMHVLRSALWAQKYKDTASIPLAERLIADAMWHDIVDGACNPPLTARMKERIENGEK